MTLILNCFTPEYVIQVSDRRLTNSKGEIAENNENKVVDWGGQVVFGYTGLARVRGKPTDYWLSEALLSHMSPQGTVSLNAAIDSLCTKATEDFRQIIMKDKRWKKLIILGVGWIDLFDTMETKPAICRVSNCIDNEGKYLDEPEDEFRAGLYVVDALPKGFYVTSIGQLIDATITQSLKHNVSRCLHQGTGPEPISRILVDAVRRVAKNNPTVGSNVLVACIPKESLNRSRIRMSDNSIGYLISCSKPRKSERTFLYVPEGRDEGVNYGPNFILGGTWLRDFRESGEEVQVRTMRLEQGAKLGLVLFEDGTKAQFISPPQ